MENGGEMLQLCRLCLVKDDVNIPIFEEQGDIRQIFLKISSCLPVKVSREDKLPKKICDGCSYKLDMLYEFWNTSANAEKQLLSWLGEAGMNSQMTDGTISAVAQQIKPVETVVKQEEIDPSDINTEENDDDKSYMFQQKFSMDEPAGPSATVTSNDEEPPPPKRARRTAAVKAQIAMDNESDDDDDDSGEPMTKIEDESDESDGEDHEPAFVDVPSTSADDQPGPSGVGKDGVEAPRKRRRKKMHRKKHMKRKSKRSTDEHPPPLKLEQPIQCDDCEQYFTNNVEFAIHSKCHDKDGKYTCHLCINFRNASKYQIEMHVRAHEGTTKYKCEICNQGFTISTHAIEHKYFHTGEKPFQCEICGKHFMYSWFLSRHRKSSHYEILTGSPLVKYDCSICEKHYATASSLSRHKLSKHKKIDGTVLCDICGKRLSSREKLKFHLRTHTGYKPHGCNFCPKSFSKKDQLVEHVRVHTGEKPYVCKYCGRGFTQRTPLKTHEKTHVREIGVCTICGQIGNCPHLQNCLKEEDVSCSTCGQPGNCTHFQNCMKTDIHENISCILCGQTGPCTHIQHCLPTPFPYP